ncbi:MAG: putative tellurite resistance protein B-like protein [Arenicella sp.]
MLKSLKNLFKKAKVKKEPSDQDLKLAAATLMFEVIRSDGTIDQIELVSMGKILSREFNLNQQELDELFTLAEDSANQAISLQGFTRDICDNWGNTKRMKLLEYLWMLALADERIDPHERHLVRKVGGLLYLNDSEVAQSREQARQKLASQSLETSA